MSKQRKHKFPPEVEREMQEWLDSMAQRLLDERLAAMAEERRKQRAEREKPRP